MFSVITVPVIVLSFQWIRTQSANFNPWRSLATRWALAAHSSPSCCSPLDYCHIPGHSARCAVIRILQSISYDHIKGSNSEHVNADSRSANNSKFSNMIHRNSSAIITLLLQGFCWKGNFHLSSPLLFTISNYPRSKSSN